MTKADPLRTQLATILDWSDAHTTFDQAVDGVPAGQRGITPPHHPHSVWQLVEHIRLAQRDILDFCRRSDYHEKKWPDDYWPAAGQSPSESQWTASIKAFHADLDDLKALALDASLDLFGRIPHGSGQTYFRELLLVADHTSYHVGQIVLVRRALGIWS
jgi:uncharacterized damage-inducible protein DinB